MVVTSDGPFLVGARIEWVTSGSRVGGERVSAGPFFIGKHWATVASNILKGCLLPRFTLSAARQNCWRSLNDLGCSFIRLRTQFQLYGQSPITSMYCSR